MIYQDKSISQREFINEPMTTLLSEMAALGEITSQSTHHQQRILSQTHSEACTKYCGKRLDISNTIMTISAQKQGLTRPGEPLSEFDYPTNKGRSVQTVNRLRAAEAKCTLSLICTEYSPACFQQLRTMRLRLRNMQQAGSISS